MLWGWSPSSEEPTRTLGWVSDKCNLQLSHSHSAVERHWAGHLGPQNVPVLHLSEGNISHPIAANVTRDNEVRAPGTTSVHDRNSYSCSFIFHENHTITFWWIIFIIRIIDLTKIYDSEKFHKYHRTLHSSIAAIQSKLSAICFHPCHATELILLKKPWLSHGRTQWHFGTLIWLLNWLRLETLLSLAFGSLNSPGFPKLPANNIRHGCLTGSVPLGSGLQPLSLLTFHFSPWVISFAHTYW